MRLVGNLELNAGFTASSAVHLLGAHIGGVLDLRGAQLTNPGATALNADGLTVDQSMVCSEGSTADGEVRLLGAHIGGQLSISKPERVRDLINQTVHQVRTAAHQRQLAEQRDLNVHRFEIERPTLPLLRFPENLHSRPRIQTKPWRR